MPEFKIVSEYKMCGDQPEAVDKLVKGLNRATGTRLFLA